MIKKLIFLIIGLCWGQEVSFMRFYSNDHNYMADDRLLSTQRFGIPYIQVFYNDQKVPLIKERLDASGEVFSREVFEYNNGKKLIRQFFLNSDQKPDSLIQFGIDEPWSEEFRKALKNKTRGYFTGQESKFILNASDQIEKIQFYNVQGLLYGHINFIYDHLGLLKGEVWTSLPNNIVIRRYAYAVDMLTGRKEIWEYGKKGEEVSHVALTQPPASSLYKTLPPRLGNRLDEISIILEDIREKKIEIPFDVFIPKTDYDLMILTNGDSLMIQLLDLGPQRVTFQIIGETDTLTMPKFRLESITSKYGERIFP